MIAWLATAWNRTLVEFSKFNDDAYKYVFLICPFGMIFAAFFFAVHDYGRVNILISFVAGFFTGALFILLPFGALLLWVFLGIFLSNLTGQKEPTKRVLVNFLFYCVSDCCRCFVDCVHRFFKIRADHWRPTHVYVPR